MGMTANYLRVTKEELEEYLKDSSKLEIRIYGNGTHDPKTRMDVDKSWEGLFFMLTGKSLATADEALTPLSWTLMPPQVIDPMQNLGYGAATYTNVDQTKEVSRALNKIELDEYKSRFNGQRMMEMEIYPEIWNDQNSLEYLSGSFSSLKEFYNAAAEKGQAIIIFIN